MLPLGHSQRIPKQLHDVHGQFGLPSQSQRLHAPSSQRWGSHDMRSEQLPSPVKDATCPLQSWPATWRGTIRRAFAAIIQAARRRARRRLFMCAVEPFGVIYLPTGILSL
jgi:hypothetical protein